MAEHFDDLLSDQFDEADVVESVFYSEAELAVINRLIFEDTDPDSFRLAQLETFRRQLAGHIRRFPNSRLQVLLISMDFSIYCLRNRLARLDSVVLKRDLTSAA